MRLKEAFVSFSLILLVFALMCLTAPEASFAGQPPSFDPLEERNDPNANPSDIEGHFRIRLASTTAEVGAYKSDGRIKRLYGQAFSSGVSAEESAENFLKANAHLWGVNPTELSDRYLQPIMYDQKTGKYKFSGIYYSQYKDGVPVFRARLILLVRNEPGYPLVQASAELRNLGGFEPKVEAKSLNSSLGITNALRSYPGLVNFTQPEMVIWAGLEEMMVEPTLAYSFVGDNYGSPDALQPEKYLFITNAETGEILYQEDLIIFEDVIGNVQGKATQGVAADFCGDELPEPLPWARVNIGSTNAYTDATGDFVISNSGILPVTVESRLLGRWFSVTNQAGSNSVLSQIVTPPGPANFMHNDLNTSEFVRAEVNGYLQANVVRDHILKYNPSYPGLQQNQFPVYVNATGGYCPGNAWYDGSSITFCQSGGGYPNTAWSAIIYHEYGHHLVAMAGSGQEAYGEGMGDAMGVLIQDVSGTGFGFTGNCNTPLRDANNTLQYPCSGEIHYCGQLLSGCIWSTRNELLVTNPITYRHIISNLAINAMLVHTGSSIDPSITIDYLTLDDDNGNINDGTPHYNEIAAGFGAHNMDAPPLALLSFSFPNGLPEIVSPSGGTTARVVVSAVTAQPQPGTGVLHFNSGSGWQEIPMTEIDPNVYDAVFPEEECGTPISYYFHAQTTTGQTQYWPAGAPNDLYYTVSATSVEQTFADNFNSDLGWTVQNDPNLTDGPWGRGIPAGGGERGDPSTDFDGSGYCYLTDNVYGNSDVDGGITWLISPLLDLSAGEDAQIHYALWYTNYFGADPNNDLFKTYVSSNGGTNWTLVHTIGPVTSDGWKEYTFMVGDFFTPTDQVKVRFEASDLNSPSVVEAGVDDFRVSIYQCMSCGDVNKDEIIDVSDVIYLINYLFVGGPSPDPFETGDVNSDALVDIADVIYLINYLFVEGPEPDC